MSAIFEDREFCGKNVTKSISFWTRPSDWPIQNGTPISLKLCKLLVNDKWKVSCKKLEYLRFLWKENDFKFVMWEILVQNRFEEGPLFQGGVIDLKGNSCVKFKLYVFKIIKPKPAQPWIFKVFLDIKFWAPPS